MVNSVPLDLAMVPREVPCFDVSYRSEGDEYAEFLPYIVIVRAAAVELFQVTLTFLTLPPDVVETIPELLLLDRSWMVPLPPAD